MACNCEGNVYNIGMGCCKPVVANPNAYYTKSEVDEKLEEIQTSGVTEERAQEMIDESLESYYTKTEVDGVVSNLEAADSVISGAVDNLSSDLATEAQRAISSEQALDGKIDTVSGNLQTQIQTIENELQGDYASKEWVSGFTYDKQTIEDMIEEGGGFVPEDYYDKDATDALLAAKSDKSTTYTKTEVDNAITSATNDMATKTWVNNQGYLTEHQSLANYYTKGEVDAKIPSLVGYATESWVSGYTYDKQTIEDMIEEGGGFIPENYYTKTETDGLLANKADTTAVTQVSNTLTAHTANTTVHVTANEKSTWNAKSDFSGSYNDLTDKPTIPVVPTNVSAFNNDSGYITSSAISGKVDTSVYNAYTAATATALSGKQDTLTAGSGITISNNTISAKIWSGTKAQYEALTNKDADCIYLIYED